MISTTLCLFCLYFEIGAASSCLNFIFITPSDSCSLDYDCYTASEEYFVRRFLIDRYPELTGRKFSFFKLLLTLDVCGWTISILRFSFFVGLAEKSGGLSSFCIFATESRRSRLLTGLDPVLEEF